MEQVSKKEKIEKPKSFLEIINEIESQGLPDLLILDLDGVLVETSFEKFIAGLFLYFADKNKFKDFVNKNKIPFSYLKKLIELSQKTKVIILTNRLLRNTEDILKNIFPFISRELIDKFKEFEVEIIPQSFKPFIMPRVKDLVRGYKKIVYIGSSFLDQKTAKALQKTNPNLSYFQIGGSKLI